MPLKQTGTDAPVPFRSGGCLARAGTLSGKKVPGLAHFHVILWGAFNSLLFLVDGSMMGRWVPVRGRGPIRCGSWPNHCERGSVFQPANRRSARPPAAAASPVRAGKGLLAPFFFLRKSPSSPPFGLVGYFQFQTFQGGRRRKKGGVHSGFQVWRPQVAADRRERPAPVSPFA